VKPLVGWFTLSTNAWIANAPCFPYQGLKLTGDFAAGGLLTERQAGNRDHDQQQGGNGEHGVVRQRCAHALYMIIAPCVERGLDQDLGFLRRHFHILVGAGSGVPVLVGSTLPVLTTSTGYAPAPGHA
jgi:hypothetical protein